MIKNIILQHYNGKPKELEKLSFENISNYAELIGADHKVIGGKPFNENLTNPCQKVHCISEEWDDYDNVLMLDPDVFIRKNLTENISKLNSSFQDNQLVKNVIDFITKDKKRSICTPFS